MASLRDAADKMTTQLDELVEQMRQELTEGDVDFEKLGSLADQISERADGLAETFTSVNEALMQRIGEARGGGSESDDESQQSQDGKSDKAESKSKA